MDEVIFFRNREEELPKEITDIEELPMVAEKGDIEWNF